MSEANATSRNEPCCFARVGFVRLGLSGRQSSRDRKRLALFQTLGLTDIEVGKRTFFLEECHFPS